MPDGALTAAEHGRDRHAEEDGSIHEVIRPAAIVPEHAARLVLVELARRDIANGGEWRSEPQLWSRYTASETSEAESSIASDSSEAAREGDPGDQRPLLGTIHVAYGTPTKYEITIYRVSLTAEGVAAGWTVAALCDEALGFGGLTLAECPRANVQQPPRPYRF